VHVCISFVKSASYMFWKGSRSGKSSVLLEVPIVGMRTPWRHRMGAFAI